jgi:hypothetical protein
MPLSPDHAWTSAAVAGPNAARYRTTSSSGALSLESGFASQLSAGVNRAAEG